MRPRLLRLSVSLLSVSVLLLLLWLLLLSTAPARSSSSPVNAPTRSGIITDTRWLKLIRAGVPGLQLNRSTSALPTLNLHLTDNLIAGHASSPSLITIVVWRNNSIIGNASVTPYPDGQSYFYAVPIYPLYIAQGGGGGYVMFQPGDVISLTQAGASFTMTVPSLTAWLDAQADRVFGSAPISSVVTTYLYSYAASTGPYTQTVSVDANGNYHADYAGTVDVHPRDSGYAAYSEAPGRTTYVRFVAPFLRAQVSGSEISGLAAPYSTVMITVADAAGTPYSYGGAYTAPDGSFESYTYYGNIKLKPGDRIIAASARQTFSMTVMTLTAQIDLANHLLWGDAPANQVVEALRFDGPLCCMSNSFWNDLPAEKSAVTATVTEQYTATLALTRPNYGAAILTTPDGNQTYARFAVPYLAAWMGSNSYGPSYQLTGQVDDVAAPVTITILGPSGYFKDVRSVTAASDGYFADYASSGLVLDTADVITVTTAQGMQAALQLPNLTGQIDPVTDSVSGTAPPGARLTLTIYYYESPSVPPVPTPASSVIAGGGGPPSTPYMVIVTATAQGAYLVNLHGVLDLDNSSTGEVGLTTAEGHRVTRVLSLSRLESCDYHPSLIHVGGNQLDFWPTLKGCSQYTYGSVRLRDAAGHLKDEEALPLWPWYYFSIYFYTGTQPVAIAPGDTVEVEWYNSPQFVPTPMPTYTPWAATPSSRTSALRLAANTQLITIVVPTLTVQLDPVTNIISGQAPASTTVTLNLYRDKNQLGAFTAVADTQGVYSVDLTGGVILAPGDVARAIYTPIDPPAFSAVGVLPMLRVQLYQSNVDGVLPPFSAYTATLHATPPITATYKGIASDDGDFSFWLAPIKPGDTITVTASQRVLQLTVPSLTAHVDRASATVFGQAPSLSRLRVEPYSYSGVSQDVTATISGMYSASFPSLAPLSTTYGKLTYFDAEGDQAVLSFATVHWEVVVNDKCLTGIVDVAGTPLTLTLRNNSGGLKSTLLLTPTYSNYSACFTTTVQSNDKIFLKTASATEVFTVPVLTAQHNYVLQAVEGAAPPDHELFSEFPWVGGGTRRVFANSSGHYGVDTSDLHPPLLSRGRVFLRDEAGNITSIYFTVTGYQTFLPIMRR